ncbi:NTP transferase domain-containing protein [Candidatus Saccharibacteria bacterium]|jgi:UTP--glucose-1-phosphate uridylyltransferase|nr:NTP transferase domain-containing protein [Candidatus Saccharibacteria bacterium]MBR3378231.1 NTP transferase domain-containing protein [Candidatus Saccharibacteria bacterium]
MSFKKPTKAVITDAGFASRFLPITKTVPKGMIPLGAKPIMQYVVEECVAGGIKQIIIVATHEGKPIYEDYFNNPCEKIYNQLASQGKLDRFESVREVLDMADITVIEQDPELPYGNGSPIASAKPFLADDEAFIALYSDDLIFGEGDVKTLVEAYEKHPDAKAIITAQEMPKEVWKKYGMIALKDKNKMTLSHIVEKPAKPEDSPSNLTSYGRYLLTPEVFAHLVPGNTGLDNELWTVDAITKLAKSGDVIVTKSKGKWLTTGDPDNYRKAFEEFYKMEA